MTEKKTITAETRLMAFALFTMSAKHYEKAREFETQMLEVLGVADDFCSHISDAIYGGAGGFDKAMEREGFVVRARQKKTAKKKPSR